MSLKIQIPMLNSKEVYSVLRNKGIHNLFHANTVKTSLTFIDIGSLLSRNYVEKNDLVQTIQYTDEKDKKLGIWDSVFLDGTDLHKKYATYNKYGPILFYIDLDFLLSEDFPGISITKTNPDSWHTTVDKFYEEIREFDNDYLTGNKLKDGRIMFLFNSPKNKMQLKKYCKKILIDDPRINLIYPDETEKPISEMIKKTITIALQEKKLSKIEVEIRHLEEQPCGCYYQYKNMYSLNKINFDRLFKK